MYDDDDGPVSSEMKPMMMMGALVVLADADAADNPVMTPANETIATAMRVAPIRMLNPPFCSSLVF
jgi:hypothetical protein